MQFSRLILKTVTSDSAVLSRILNFSVTLFIVLMFYLARPLSEIVITK